LKKGNDKLMLSDPESIQLYSISTSTVLKPKYEISADRTAETQQVLRIDTTPQLVLTTDVDKIFANLAEIFT
jgi:hypothetical protein